MKKQHIISFSFPFFLFLILVAFIALRLVHLPESVGFGSDAGRDFLEIYSIVQEKKVKLLGPSSQFAVDGRNFYFGPAPYYIMAPILVIANWDVLVASRFLILINAVVLLLSLIILYSSLKKSQQFMVYPYALLLTFTVLLVNYSRTYWNPHFMLPVSTLLVSLIMHMRTRKTSSLYIFSIGFLWGLGMQFHYSFVLAILVCIVLIWRQLTKRVMLILLTGFIIGFSPIILFELLNSFYNLRTMFLFVSRMNNDSRLTGTPHYYFISLMPFFFLAISWILTQLRKKYAYLTYVLLGMYVLINLAMLLPKPSHGYDMAQNWNYEALEKTADIILADSPTNFNIVDQRTGDNRAMAVRYLLTTRNVKPLGIEEYPQAQTLYIYTHEPIEKILKNPIWEISSANGSKVTKLGTINQTTVYKLQK